MTFRNYSIRTDKYGFKRYLKRYECEDCSDCPLRSQCNKAKSDKNREIQKNMNREYFKARIQQLHSEEETGKIYRQRKFDVKPAFGYLKSCLGFTRFSVRGKQQVHNEVGFALLAVNLRKYRLNKAVTNDNFLDNLKKQVSKIIFMTFDTCFIFLGAYVPSSFLLSDNDCSNECRTQWLVLVPFGFCILSHDKFLILEVQRNSPLENYLNSLL